MAPIETTGRAALARRGYESFQTGDMDTLRSLLASDIGWHSPGQGEGHFHAVDAVMADFGRLLKTRMAASASR
jgi:ketosteroid isomerase-like protein